MYYRSPPRWKLAVLAVEEKAEDGGGQAVGSGQQGEALKRCAEVEEAWIRARVGVSVRGICLVSGMWNGSGAMEAGWWATAQADGYTGSSLGHSM